MSSLTLHTPFTFSKNQESPPSFLKHSATQKYKLPLWISKFFFFFILCLALWQMTDTTKLVTFVFAYQQLPPTSISVVRYIEYKRKRERKKEQGVIVVMSRSAGVYTRSLTSREFVPAFYYYDAAAARGIFFFVVVFFFWLCRVVTPIYRVRWFSLAGDLMCALLLPRREYKSSDLSFSLDTRWFLEWDI